MKVDDFVFDYLYMFRGKITHRRCLKLPYLYIHEPILAPEFETWFNWINRFICYNDDELYHILWTIILENLTSFDETKLNQNIHVNRYIRKYNTTWTSYVYRHLHYWVHKWLLREEKQPRPSGLEPRGRLDIPEEEEDYKLPYHGSDAIINTIKYMYDSFGLGLYSVAPRLGVTRRGIYKIYGNPNQQAGV